MFTNIWNHPKTSAAGLLIAIVTAAGVLSQQGISLGHAGTGTVIGLVGALATAFLGLLSEDPGSALKSSIQATTPAQAPSDRTKQVLGLVLVASLLGATTMTGCTASQVNTVVQEISSYLPTVVALVNDGLAIATAVGSTGSTSTAVDSSVATALKTASADLQNLEPLLATYLSKSSSSADKTTAWTNIQALVDTAVTDTDNLLTLAAVKNANSSAEAVTIIASINAAVHVLDGYVSSAQSTNQVQAKMAKRTVKLHALMKLWAPKDKELVESKLGAPALNWALAQGY